MKNETVRGEDSNREAQWQLWAEDTFDRETPRRIEEQGRGLLNGLTALWRHFLQDGLGRGGIPGFWRFNLWWTGLNRSTNINGNQEGAARIHGWACACSSRPDPDRLHTIASTHARLIETGAGSEELLTAARGAADTEDLGETLRNLV